jgi:CelD/BcsL family acetyltransferase involved in cellulose biosynthesis
MGARPSLDTLTVTVAHGHGDLARIVPQLEELALEALEPNPFYEPWMLLPALRAYAGGQELRIVLVWAGERLVGLFPFERRRGYKGLPAGALVSWRHRHCLLCTPLVRADSARQCLEALFGALDASLIEFSYLPAGEPFHRALIEALGARGLRSTVNRSYSRGLLRKHSATISGRLRRQLANNEKRLRKHGALAHVALGPHHDIGRWIEDFLALEAAGWKGRRGSAMGSTAVDREYAQQIFTAAFRRGRLLVVGLDLDGRPIARRFSFTAGEGAYAFKTAYDERFAACSPGVMLEADNVRQVDAAPGIAWMDSFTEDANLAVSRMWPERRVMQALAVGVRPWGALAVAALPWLRWIKSRMR